MNTCDGKQVKCFVIAGEDKQFYCAIAIIEGGEVVVYSDKVNKPVAVCYAWADNPVCNLVNLEGLPAIHSERINGKLLLRNISDNLKCKQINIKKHISITDIFC